MIKRFIATATATFVLAFAINVAADEADRRQALFGDVHIHTQLSFDAYIFGIRRTPDDAYRYALGETLRIRYRVKGRPVRLLCGDRSRGVSRCAAYDE